MSALIWKRRLGRLLGGRSEAHRDVILLYHSVAGGEFSVQEARFRAQMAWLKDNAHVTTMDELLDISNPGLLRVVLSFDDGYRSLHDTVHHVLAAHNFPAVVYLNSGMVGEGQHPPSSPDLGHYPGEHFLTWSEVTHLAGHGWTVGGHGVDHVDLTKSPAKETQWQLEMCKTQIETRLRVSCDHFAYTWGRFTPSLQRAVKVAGYADRKSVV